MGKLLQISNSTIKRITMYYRVLLETRDTHYIRSDEIAKIVGFNPSLVRRDLMHFSQVGVTGKGYPVNELKSKIVKMLGIEKPSNVAVIGVGNLGTALVNYRGFHHEGFKIIAAFDIDHRKINRVRNGIPIYGMDSINKIAREKNVKIAIITVPVRIVQDVVNKVVATGIKSILNFAPAKVMVPVGVNVLNIDMTVALSRLSYMTAAQKVLF